MTDHSLSDPAALMRWYLDAGVDETIGEEAVDRFKALPPKPVAAPPRAAVSFAPASASPPTPGCALP